MKSETESKRGEPPSVEAGEEHTAPIAGTGKNGDPFVKIDGYVLFLKDREGNKIETKPEGMVHIKVTKVLPNFGFAELIE